MNACLTPNEPETAGQDEQDSEFFRGILHRLITAGTGMAEEVHAEAKANAAAAEPGATPMADATIPFDRAARTVRRCIVLARHVAKPLPVAKDAGLDRKAARKQVIRRVEDAIHREAAPYESESLRAEMLERLDAPEFEDDLGRPVREIIDEICADLGILGPDSLDHWKRRTPRDVATLCAQAAGPPQEAVGPFNLPMPPPGWVDPAWRSGGIDEGPPRVRGSPADTS